MKQTAVEWFAKELYEKFEMRGDGKLFDQIIEQAKAMQNEHMVKFAEFVATYPDKNRNIHGDMLHAKSKYDGTERTIDLLEMFKSE